MTIKDLKELLQDYINKLDETYGDIAEVRLFNNTYFINRGDTFIATTKGFIDLDNPLDEDDEY